MIRIEDLKWDESGLIPAVVQDATTGEVLTVAYVSPESLAKTRELGETVFYSRSRQSLWHKGETSGNYQKVVSVSADCDADAVLVRVEPAGPACHTGARSCFFQPVAGFPSTTSEGFGLVIDELSRVIADRKARLPEGSHTAKLFKKGREHILHKVGEEATEMVIAAMSADLKETAREASDLLYYLLVALAEMGISLEEVAAEIRSRRK